MPTATIHVTSKLTQEYLKSILRYDPETGVFTWLVKRNSRGGKVRPGAPAGQVNKYGYLVIGIDGERHFAHRLAWLYMTGAWPEDEVDHENRMPGDNRWINLRPATSTQQKINTGMRCDNSSGIRGVWFDAPRRKWSARIGVEKRKIFLGRFDSIDLAAEARRLAELRYFGEYAPS